MILAASTTLSEYKLNDSDTGLEVTQPFMEQGEQKPVEMLRWITEVLIDCVYPKK